MRNTSGIRPCEFNVLVLQDKVEEKTRGGLYLASETQDKEKFGMTKGTIVALSPLAFNEDIWPVCDFKPRPGERVAFAKHAGTFVMGDDGVEYRMIKDKDVTATLDGDHD